MPTMQQQRLLECNVVVRSICWQQTTNSQTHSNTGHAEFRTYRAGQTNYLTISFSLSLYMRGFLLLIHLGAKVRTSVHFDLIVD